MSTLRILAVLFAVLITASVAAAQGESAAENVIEDAGTGMSREEVEFLVTQWPSHMQQAAANDTGDRIELLNMGLAIKKMASEADEMAASMDRKTYWEYQYALRNVKRKFVVDSFLRNLEVPDMNELAQERYLTEKDKYARVPEKRLSSHILLGCVPGACERDDRRPEAASILAQLQAGADFEEMVDKYSEEPGAKERAGKYSTWLSLGMPDVSPPYVGAVFDIEKIGDYAPVTETQFGFHIIRLDGIEESHYKPYEEVEAQIVATLNGEFTKLAAKNFEDKYRLGDEAYLNGEVLDEIFAPYKMPEAPAVDKQPAPVQPPAASPAGEAAEHQPH